MEKLIYSIVFSLLLMSNVNAANQDARDTVITKLTTYTQSGNGDVIISATITAPNCGGGFWLSPTDPGFNAALSTLLSAYHSKSIMNLGVEDTVFWDGSASRFCRLIYAELK